MKDSASFEHSYKDLHASALAVLLSRIQDDLCDNFRDLPRVDRIVVRAKSPDRFLAKAAKLDESGQKKYPDPLNQIQDIIGARVVGFYLSDIPSLEAIVEKYYQKIEKQNIMPEKPNEFGYEGKHFILFIPDECLTGLVSAVPLPKYFELQIKTLFQHAWAEAEHDVGYKSLRELNSQEKRYLAYAAAQAWGADRIFDEMISQPDRPTID